LIAAHGPFLSMRCNFQSSIRQMLAERQRFRAIARLRLSECD
jgi:hypothetical protein